MAAHKFTPLDKDLIPLGTFADVAGNPMDFLEKKKIGENLEANFDQIVLAGKGYDCCWILDSGNEKKIRLAAQLVDPISGRALDVSTTCPAIQVYSGNFLDNTPGKKSKKMPKWSGVCLETQFPADAPNRPDFPSIVLRPGDKYTSTTVFKFSVVP